MGMGDGTFWFDKIGHGSPAKLALRESIFSMMDDWPRVLVGQI